SLCLRRGFGLRCWLGLGCWRLFSRGFRLGSWLLLRCGLLLGSWLLLRCGLLLGSLCLGGLFLVRCRSCAAANAREDRAHLDGLVFAHHDLGEGAGEWRRNLGVDLVGGDLEQRLVGSDLVADGLEPARDGALRNRLA